MKGIAFGMAAMLAAQCAAAHPLDGAPGVLDAVPREAPAKRNDEPIGRGAVVNRLMAKAGRDIYKPVTVCRGDGDRDVVIGGQGDRGDTFVGRLDVIDRAQCPGRYRTSDADGILDAER